MRAIDGVVRADIKISLTADSARLYEGKKVAIVGGTNGIGRALGLELAAKGAEVIVIGQTFRDAGTPNLRFIQADLSTADQARRVADELPAETLDVVVFTSGILAAKTRQANADGIELDMAISYLSRFVILRQIAGRLGNARPSPKAKPRVFVYGFPGTDIKAALDDFNSEQDYRYMAVHYNTVVGNEALVLDGAKRYPGINVYGLNPGILKSNIRANIFGQGTLLMTVAESIINVLFGTPDTYAKKILPLLVSPQLEKLSGTVFNRKGQAIASNPFLADDGVIQRVMVASEQLAHRSQATV